MYSEALKTTYLVIKCGYHGNHDYCYLHDAYKMIQNNYIFNLVIRKTCLHNFLKKKI